MVRRQNQQQMRCQNLERKQERKGLAIKMELTSQRYYLVQACDNYWKGVSAIEGPKMEPQLGPSGEPSRQALYFTYILSYWSVCLYVHMIHMYVW